MTRRPPAKRRGERSHVCCPAAVVAQAPEDASGIPAPGHLGGQFEDAGYGHITGTFGFSQWMPGQEDP